jgi:hypothetical protein
MSKHWLLGTGAFVAVVAVGMFFVLARAPVQRVQPVARAEAPAVPQAERIDFPSLGLSVARPLTWSTITAEENVRNLRSVEMDDRQLQELAIRYSAAPIVAFAKYKEPYADLNPSFKVNVRRLGSFAGQAPEQILAAAIPTLARMFADLKVSQQPTPTTLSGKRAAYAELAYTLRAGGKEMPTISQIWVVPSGPVFFMIATGTRADEKKGTRAEARAIVDSIQLR